MRVDVPARSEKEPDQFAVVVIGSPVWAGHLPAPMRSYLKREYRRFARAAAFWVSGSGNAYQSLKDEIDNVAGCRLIVTETFRERDIQQGGRDGKILSLTQKIEKLCRNVSRERT